MDLVVSPDLTVHNARGVCNEHEIHYPVVVELTGIESLMAALPVPEEAG